MQKKMFLFLLSATFLTTNDSIAKKNHIKKHYKRKKCFVKEFAIRKNNRKKTTKRKRLYSTMILDQQLIKMLRDKIDSLNDKNDNLVYDIQMLKDAVFGVENHVIRIQKQLNAENIQYNKHQKILSKKNNNIVNMLQQLSDKSIAKSDVKSDVKSDGIIIDNIKYYHAKNNNEYMMKDNTTGKDYISMDLSSYSNNDIKGINTDIDFFDIFDKRHTYRLGYLDKVIEEKYKDMDGASYYKLKNNLNQNNISFIDYNGNSVPLKMSPELVLSVLQHVEDNNMKKQDNKIIDNIQYYYDQLNTKYNIVNNDTGNNFLSIDLNSYNSPIKGLNTESDIRDMIDSRNVYALHYFDDSIKDKFTDMEGAFYYSLDNSFGNSISVTNEDGTPANLAFPKQFALSIVPYFYKDEKYKTFTPRHKKEINNFINSK